MTGVFNRRYLDRRLTEEVARARRHGLALSILMIDIDHFKAVNDQHGHPAGDHVLKLFADLIKRNLRESDIAARYGGEEFLVIVPHTAREGAIRLAERLRAQLELNTFSLREVQTPSGIPELRVTCSIGVASLSDEVSRPALLVGCADENLLRAKQDGRNRVNADPPRALMTA